MITVYIFNTKHKVLVTPEVAAKRKVIKKDPKKVNPIEKNPLVVFSYPSKELPSKLRRVRLISADGKYLIGLEVSDHNRFKKFLRTRITSTIQLVEFNPTAMA